MSESKSDYNTAQQKIKEYREKMDDKAFSIYADTSKVFNALLSFDNNINNTDFKTGTSAIDGYQSSSMSRFVASSSADLFNRNKSYKNSSITKEEAKLNDFEIRLTTLVEQLSIEEIDRIEATVDSLITIEIDNPTLYFAKGALEHSRRQYTNAIQNYTYAIELDPENAFYYMNRAVAYTEMTDFVMQLDNQNQQLLINSDQTNQLKNIRRKYNYDDAFRDINIAIRKNPEVAHFHYNKGAILARANESVRAIESYTTAIELHPEMMEAFFNRGLILIELSDTKKGLLDISQAGELGNMEAYEILQSYSDKLNR
ncbi:MAG: tetratricopeptide repeat protein [Rikenellaceae bacterium]